MCLLISQPEGTVFDDAFLQGVYKKNGDGIGVMYIDNNKLHIRKALPQTFEDMKTFYNEHVAGRKCAVHWRMKTHGHIDLNNCHPYEVLTEEEGYPLWLMHNGVLATGNSKDVSMSDTWHYIQDFLRPMLLKNPEFFLTDAFKTIIGAHIGTGNKFALLDAFGNVVVVNERSGVTYNNAWLSNTYAWDTTGTEHDYTRRHVYYGGGSLTNSRSAFDDDDDVYPYYKTGSELGTGSYNLNGVKVGSTPSTTTTPPTASIASKVFIEHGKAFLGDGAQVLKDLEADPAYVEDRRMWIEYMCATLETDAFFTYNAVNEYALRCYYNLVGEDAAWDLLDQYELMWLTADMMYKSVLDAEYRDFSDGHVDDIVAQGDDTHAAPSFDSTLLDGSTSVKVYTQEEMQDIVDSIAATSSNVQLTY